jgi:hypothetical protein
VSHWRGGGRLGGERGGDRGCDLRLQGCGGFSHPKRNNNCGLELEKAAAAAENLWAKRRTVAGVKLDNNTASKRKTK